MTWYTYAVVSVVCNSALLLCFRRLQKSYAIEVFLFYTWLATALILFVISTPDSFYHISPLSLGLLIIAGIASWAGNYAYNLSIGTQRNIGYVEALSSVRIPTTYVISLFFLGSPFEIVRLIAIFGVLIGIILVTRGREDYGQISISNSRWVTWAIISGLMFGVLAICTRIVFKLDVSVTIGTGLFLFFAALLYGVTSVFRKTKLSIGKDKVYLVAAIIFSALANYTLFASYSTAPNLGYPVAISSSRVILLYLISLVLASEMPNSKKLLGVLITFISVLILA